MIAAIDYFHYRLDQKKVKHGHHSFQQSKTQIYSICNDTESCSKSSKAGNRECLIFWLDKLLHQLISY